MSQQLNGLQQSALNRLGDVLCPAFQDFPAFSELDVVHYADVVLDELPEGDLNDLKMLLTVLFFLPRPLLKLMMAVLDKMKDMNGGVGTLVRMLLFGLRGLTFALYYSGLKGPKATATKTPVDVVGFQVNVSPV
jgi:hypothetical protein